MSVLLLLLLLIFLFHTAKFAAAFESDHKLDLGQQVEVLEYLDGMHEQLKAGLTTQKEEIKKLENKKQNVFRDVWML